MACLYVCTRILKSLSGLQFGRNKFPKSIWPPRHGMAWLGLAWSGLAWPPVPLNLLRVVKGWPQPRAVLQARLYWGKCGPGVILVVISVKDSQLVLCGAPGVHTPTLSHGVVWYSCSHHRAMPCRFLFILVPVTNTFRFVSISVFK